MSYLFVDINGFEYVVKRKPKNNIGDFTNHQSAIRLPENSIEKLIGMRLEQKDGFYELFEEEKTTDIFTQKVCEYAGIHPKLLKRKLKRDIIEITEVRAIIMAYRKIILGMSLHEAGYIFKKDHATVLYAISTMQNDYKHNREYRQKFKKIFEEYPLLLLYKKKYYRKSLNKNTSSKTG